MLLLEKIFCNASYVTFHDTTLRVTPIEGLQQRSLMPSWINSSLTFRNIQRLLHKRLKSETV